MLVLSSLPKCMDMTLFLTTILDTDIIVTYAKKYTVGVI